MAYSHTRLRKTLALTRILTGIVFLSTGGFKVASLEFGREIFPAFLDNALRGGAVGWFRPVLEWVVSVGPARVGITLGFAELFIGMAMLLGLAVRPAALIGLLYMAFLQLSTWNVADSGPTMLRSTEYQFRNLFPFLVFLMLGIGHAGETWGVGALYHRHRGRLWEKDETEKMPALVVEPEHEPASFEEFVEAEERAAEERRARLAAAAESVEWSHADGQGGES